jgi:hypothetical protein
MSDATDYLSTWIQIAQQRAPSMTRVTTQRSLGVGPPPNWKPGIASFGYGINGGLVKDPNGNDIGITMETWVWFSDRGQDLSDLPPKGQQFIEAAFDKEIVSITLAGDNVNVNIQVTLESWGNTVWNSSTSVCDTASQQLVFFGIPGAGPNAPAAMMVLSFADTGQFGWL